MKNKKVVYLVAVLALMLAEIVVTPTRSDADETSLANESAETSSERNTFQIGLLTGPTAEPDSGPLALGISFGARVEYKPTPWLGMGLFGMHTNFGAVDYFIASQSLEQTVLGAEVRLYPFSNNGLYASGKIAASLLSTEITAWDQSIYSQSRTDLLLGGSVGYNFKLSRSVSMGPEVAYMDVPTANGPGHLISTLVNLNYGF